MKDVRQLIAEAEEKSGIDLSQLEIGTKIEMQTVNTLYHIEVLPENKFMVQGGHFFIQPIETYIGGSTYGGSMIKLKWLGINMHAEIGTPHRASPLVTTSAIRSIKVIGPNDKWNYTLPS